MKTPEEEPTLAARPRAEPTSAHEASVYAWTPRYLGHRHPNPTTCPQAGEPDWFTPRQACDFADVSLTTLAQWRVAGLLPATRSGSGHTFTYARLDIVRILRAPRRGRAGVDRRAVLAAIARDGARSV